MRLQPHHVPVHRLGHAHGLPRAQELLEPVPVVTLDVLLQVLDVRIVLLAVGTLPPRPHALVLQVDVFGETLLGAEALGAELADELALADVDFVDVVAEGGLVVELLAAGLALVTLLVGPVDLVDVPVKGDVLHHFLAVRTTEKGK